MTNLMMTEQATLPLRLASGPATNTVFSENSLGEMLYSLDRHYALLKNMLVAPSVVKYEELAQLRRQSIQPDFGTSLFGRFQSQLRLAMEFFRLGRRSEGFRLLAQVDERLPLASKELAVRTTSLVYGLWLALLRAAVGDKVSALATAQQLVRYSSDPAANKAILTFFNRL